MFGIGKRWFVVRDGQRSEGVEGVGQMVFSPDSNQLAIERQMNMQDVSPSNLTIP